MFTKHKFAHLTLWLIFLLSSPILKSQTFPCPELSWAEYLDLRNYRAAYLPTATVASNPLNEPSIPIQIIYVNEDDGTPPASDFRNYRISEEIERANQAYDGFLNFYICGYAHVNSSAQFNLVPSTANKIALLNLYHSTTAINVYICNEVISQGMSVGGASSFPNFPSSTNNFIALASNMRNYSLAHELGHYLGLSHTHDNNYFNDQTDCRLLDPAYIDTDQITDTPADPGPTLGCNVNLECPVVTTPCTLTCDKVYTSFSPPTFSSGSVTFVGYRTDNIMGVYFYCPVKTFTSGQISMMSAVLNNPLSSRYFLLTPPSSCNNNIAEDGLVIKYKLNESNGLIDKKFLKDISVYISNEVTYWDATIESDVDGNYESYQQNFSNAVLVVVKPRISHPSLLTDPGAVPDNYQPTNGVTVQDIALIQRHVLAIQQLPEPYPFNLLAADVNNSGSITAGDMTQIRRVILGLQNDFPVGTFKFLPEYYLSNSAFASGFESNPFTATYSPLSYAYPAYLDSELTLDMDDAAVADIETWSFDAVKVGDVNTSMVVDNLTGGDEGVVGYLDGSGPCLSTSDILTVTVSATNEEEDIDSYQMGIQYDRDKLAFMGSEGGDLTDFKLDNFVEERGLIRTLWYRTDGGTESMTTGKALFKLHFKVKSAFCDVNDAVYLNDNVLESVFYGSKSKVSTPAEVTMNWDKNVEDPKGHVTSIYPNPATSNVSFDIHLDEAATVKYRVWDYLGNEVSYETAYSSGNHTHTFPSTSSLSSGPLNYYVKMDDFIYSGIIIKTP